MKAIEQGNKNPQRRTIRINGNTALGALTFVTLGLLTACNGKALDRTEGESHWLKGCELDADCDTELSCVCRVCTRPCSVPSECTLVDPTATCVNAAAGPYGPQCAAAEQFMSMCVLERSVPPLGGSSDLGLASGDTEFLGASGGLGSTPAGAIGASGDLPGAGGASAGSEASGGTSGGIGASAGTSAGIGASAGASAGMGATGGLNASTGGGTTSIMPTPGAGASAGLGASGASGPAPDPGPTCSPETCIQEHCADATATIRTGDSPLDVVVGDWNGDGYLDLATSNSIAGTVSVLLGCGDGTFLRANDQAVGDRPLSIAAADLNADGFPDLITLGSGGLNTLRGNGDGTFEVRLEDFTLQGTGTREVATVDFNADGTWDIAVLDGGGQLLSTLLGDGSGGLSARTDYAIGLTNSLDTGELNGDGQPDLVAVGAGVNVLLSGATETFNAGANAAGLYGAIAIGDFTGDGILDLGVGDSGPRGGTSEFGYLPGRGDGSFETLAQLGIGDAPRSMSSGDVNNDGRTDLVGLFSEGTNGVYTTRIESRLQGNGTLNDPVLATHQQDLRRGLLSDLNGDGNLDLIVLYGNTVDILLGNGSGAFGVGDAVDGGR